MNRVQNDDKDSKVEACDTMTGYLLVFRQQVRLLALILVVIATACFFLNRVKVHAFDINAV
jgi:hypothetical protein